MLLALATGEIAVMVTTAVLALGIAVILFRLHLRNKTLRSRIIYNYLPTTTFDPTPDAVRTFARTLGRTRPTNRWVPSSATGFRIRFRTDSQGRLVSGIEGREDVKSLLGRRPYHQVDIQAVEPDDEGGATPVAVGNDQGRATPVTDQSPIAEEGSTDPPDPTDDEGRATPELDDDEMESELQ